MLDRIKKIAAASDDTYDSRRMKRGLDYPISRNKARRFMREANVQVRHLHLDAGRLVISHRDHRPLLTKSGRLEH